MSTLKVTYEHCGFVNPHLDYDEIMDTSQGHLRYLFDRRQIIYLSRVSERYDSAYWYLY